MVSGKVKIVEYGPTDDPLGYIEPVGAKPSWILWWFQDGSAQLYLQREPSGAVIGDPIRIGEFQGAPSVIQ